MSYLKKISALILMACINLELSAELMPAAASYSSINNTKKYI